GAQRSVRVTACCFVAHFSSAARASSRLLPSSGTSPTRTPGAICPCGLRETAPRTAAPTATRTNGASVTRRRAGALPVLRGAGRGVDTGWCSLSSLDVGTGSGIVLRLVAIIINAGFLARGADGGFGGLGRVMQSLMLLQPPDQLLQFLVVLFQQLQALAQF